MTTTISPDQDVMTLVNVFTVEPERQQELVDLLVQATDEVMRQLPGFVSANIHRSDDGRHVVNYAQWATAADFEAMQRDPGSRMAIPERQGRHRHGRQGGSIAA